MNRNLLIFSVLLIALGFGLGLYLISFFGFLLLIPSLMSTSRIPTRPTPTVPERRGRFQTPQRRVIPAPTARLAAPPMQPATEPLAAPTYIPPPQDQSPTFSLPIFPNAMFPAMNVTTTQAPAKTTTPAAPKGQERDELLEVGTILALLRLAFG